MTLQDRILEALGEKALKPQALFNLLRGENVSGVETALMALRKQGVVSFELGHYQRVMNGRKLAPAPAAVAAISRPIATAPADDEQLTKREREIWKLREEGLTHEAIARRLGVSSGVIGQHLSNARHKLGIKAKVGRPSRSASLDHAALSAGVPRPGAPSHEGAQAPTVGAASFPVGSQTQAIAAKPVPARGAPSGVTQALSGDGAAVPSASHGTGEPGQQSSASSRSRHPARQPGETGIFFSRDLIARLIEHQRSKAMFVQMLCDRLAMARQDLADIEELVRIATRKEGVR